MLPQRKGIGMKRLLIVIFGICMATLLPAGVLASPDPQLHWGPEVSSSNCQGGKLVVNVKQQVVNSVDDGVGPGDAWGFTEYIRQIQVREMSENTYCATASYQGTVTTIAGTSPSGNGNVPEGLNIPFQGGIRYLITGFFEPVWDTHGSIGTFDYGCNAAQVCSGAVNWVAQYFASGFTQQLEWWGFIYHGGNNGTWVNSSDGNEGDITG
jgi:hypothetical protein